MRDTMFRLCQIGLTGLLLGSSYPVFAAFDTTNSPSSATNSSGIMSPGEFNSRVNTLKQQTKSSIMDEAKQLLTAKPISSDTTPNMDATTAAKTTPQSFGTPSNTGTQNQPYSGFGANTGTPKSGGTGGNAAPSDNKQGGWNINY